MDDSGPLLTDLIGQRLPEMPAGASAVLMRMHLLPGRRQQPPRGPSQGPGSCGFPILEGCCSSRDSQLECHRQEPQDMVADQRGARGVEEGPPCPSPCGSRAQWHMRPVVRGSPAAVRTRCLAAVKGEENTSDSLKSSSQEGEARSTTAAPRLHQPLCTDWQRPLPGAAPGLPTSLPGVAGWACTPSGRARAGRVDSGGQVVGAATHGEELAMHL